MLSIFLSHTRGWVLRGHTAGRAGRFINRSLLDHWSRRRRPILLIYSRLIRMRPNYLRKMDGTRTGKLRDPDGEEN